MIIIVEFLVTVLSITYLKNIFGGWTVPLNIKYFIFTFVTKFINISLLAVADHMSTMDIQILITN